MRMSMRTADKLAGLYDRSAPKKPTNLSVNTELLQLAKKLEINLSQLLERCLEAQILEMQSAQWLAENREALEAYNEHVERDGVFSDGARGF
jgi:antitoxin CcdA